MWVSVGWSVYTHLSILPDTFSAFLNQLKPSPFSRRSPLLRLPSAKAPALSFFGSPNISWLQLVLNVGLSVHPSIRPSVRPFVRPSVRSCRLHSSFVASARSYPSASLRNANAFCFSFTTLSTPEGERARDSFNNPAARSEIYYFRATLLDKSIWLTPSPPPVAPVTPIVPRRFLLFLRAASTASDRPAGSRTSVQGDLIKLGLIFGAFGS